MDSRNTVMADVRPGLQLVNSTGQISGKHPLKLRVTGTRTPRRIKAKHLSQQTRETIVRLFASLESYDDVAREFSQDLPGLTGKTVSEVIHAWQMRKPPASERVAFLLERPTVRAFRAAAGSAA